MTDDCTVLLAVLAAVVLALACDPAQAAAEAVPLRLELTRQAIHARQWNVGWGVGFAVASVGQFAIAATNWDPIGTLHRTDRVTLYAGAAKAGIGSLGRLITPLFIDVPPVVADPCADLDALHAALADAARLERRLFWTSQIGGLVVTVGAAAIVAHETNWTTGLVSFAISYPVGLLSIYTMPRGAWHMVRATVTPMPIAGGGMGVSVGGTF
jgi:hypothetical protein